MPRIEGSAASLFGDTANEKKEKKKYVQTSRAHASLV